MDVGDDGRWIALITFSALYVGHVLQVGRSPLSHGARGRSGGWKVVGVLDMVGIYSPKTQRTTWMARASAGGSRPMLIFSRRGDKASAPHPQSRCCRIRSGQRPLTRTDSTGNRLPAMNVNVWNLRFMQSELGDPSMELPLVSQCCNLPIWATGEMRIRGRSAIALRCRWRGFHCDQDGRGSRFLLT